MKYIEPNRVNITIVQLLLPLALYWALTVDVEWYWWLVSFVAYFLYCGIGNNLAMHRYFCHKHFELSKPMESLFLWCSSMSCLGSPLSYAIPHLVHHKNPDSDVDPHGPTAGLKSLLYFYHRHLCMTDNLIINRRVVELAKRYCWLHHKYWFYVLGMAGIMYLISWKLFLFGWLLPASFTLWAVSIAIYLQHWGNAPSNNRYYSWFGFGEGLHANHHVNPGLSNTAMNPGEYDYTHMLARLFAKNKI